MSSEVMLGDLSIPAPEAAGSPRLLPVEDATFCIHEAPGTGSKSLHVTRAFRPGEALSAFGGQERVAVPNYLSLQFNETEHCMLTPEHLQYVNHSCAPNVIFDVATLQLRALQPIQAGEEVTFFYPATEWNMTQSFQCFCASPSCLGRIQGAAHLPMADLERYELAAHIRTLAERAAL